MSSGAALKMLIWIRCIGNDTNFLRIWNQVLRNHRFTQKYFFRGPKPRNLIFWRRGSGGFEQIRSSEPAPSRPGSRNWKKKIESWPARPSSGRASIHGLASKMFENFLKFPEPPSKSIDFLDFSSIRNGQPAGARI